MCIGRPQTQIVASLDGSNSPCRRKSAYARFLVFSARTGLIGKGMSGRRPVVKGLVEALQRFGCGHVFGLFARETNVPLALMLVRMALRPISKTRSLWRLPFFPGLPSRSVGSHRFAVALDADRLAAKSRSC